MPAWDGLVRVLVAVWAALVEVKTCGLAGEATIRVHRNMSQLTGGRLVVGSLKSCAGVAVA